MRYRIITSLKLGILDNAGKATTRALKSLGFDYIQSIRIGKSVELDCNSDDITKIAQSITNEVMENYIIEEV